MPTISMPVVLDEADLKALMDFFATDDPGQAVSKAVRTIVAERRVEKNEKMGRPSVVEKTHGLIDIDPQTARAIAEDAAFDLWPETECR